MILPQITDADVTALMKVERAAARFRNPNPVIHCNDVDAMTDLCTSERLSALNNRQSRTMVEQEQITSLLVEGYLLLLSEYKRLRETYESHVPDPPLIPAAEDDD